MDPIEKEEAPRPVDAARGGDHQGLSPSSGDDAARQRGRPRVAFGLALEHDDPEAVDERIRGDRSLRGAHQAVDLDGAPG